LTVLLNQVAPEDWAALERVDETIAAAMPEDALAALTTCRFCDERRCIDCPMEVFGSLQPAGGLASAPASMSPRSEHRLPSDNSAKTRRRSRRYEEPERMNDCHPTDEGRAFVIRAQPIATQTQSSGVQLRLSGVLAADGGPSSLASCALRGR
jgi:hypothetical protein